MTTPLQPGFVKMLFEGLQQPVDQTKLYHCANCHRPDVKPEFIAVISHGEAYCKGCAKEII